MNDISIEKTMRSDFEKIYPLLVLFDSPFKKENWKKLFTYQWDGARDYVGYHLKNKDNVIGFMGLIFSERNINKKKYVFCNITSLIVKPEFRAYTILFIRKILSYKEIIFTGLGPIRDSFQLLTLAGFTPFEDNYKIFPVANGLFSKKENISQDESEKIFEKCDEENKRLLSDHLHLSCQFVLFEYLTEQCLLIYHTDKQKHYKINVNKIYIRYISNTTFFNRHVLFVLNFFMKKYGLFSAVYVDGGFFTKKLLLKIGKKINPPKIRNKVYENVKIDALYSEVMLLHS